MKEIVGTHNIVFMTLDTLRYDVAKKLFHAGETPNFAKLMRGPWEERHTPGTFTYAAHHAFFCGFLPTPASPGPKETRLFASRFSGSETSGPETFLFDEPDLVTALRKLNYYTICVGGVGFFNKQTAISRVFPDLFHSSYWSPELGVTDPNSTENQFRLFEQLFRKLDPDTKLFFFINIAALHQPNYFYLTGAKNDSLETHAAALKYVDSHLPLLIHTLKQSRRPTFLIICSDHGTAYGEDGYFGHRLAHPPVLTVPYYHGIM
jgi:membrane-anchored protein YejM (alkaline phosphatase superfamily)